MKDLRVSFTFTQHPKVIKLIRECGYEGPFRLIQLWAFAAQNTPNGFLGTEDEEYFEIAAGWSGTPKKFIQSLIKIGFIDRVDNGLQIHDWEKHNPFVAGFEERSRQARINQSKRNYRNSIGANASGNAIGITDGNAPSPSPSPSPYPSPYPSPKISLSEVASDARRECQLTKKLIEGIRGNSPTAKIPANLAKWVNEARLMMERDGRSLEECMAVIEFSQRDDFWKTNILSVPKLREKFDQLFLKMKTPKKGGGNYKTAGNLEAVKNFNARLADGKN